MRRTHPCQKGPANRLSRFSEKKREGIPVTLIGLCTHRVDGDRVNHFTVCGVMGITETGRCVSVFL